MPPRIIDSDRPQSPRPAHSQRVGVEKNARKRVLVVDDDSRIRHILSKRLEFDGFEHADCPSSETGLAEYLRAHCEGHAYDALMLDMRLGAMQGRDLLALVRHADERCAILMISGESTIDSAIECIELGADDYLCKPIKVWDLRNRVNTALARRRTIYTRRPGLESMGLRFGAMPDAEKNAATHAADARNGDAHRDDAPRDNGAQDRAKTKHGGNAEAVDRDVKQTPRAPEGELGDTARSPEAEQGRTHAAGAEGRNTSLETGSEFVSQAHPSDGSSRAITPPGALIHITERLESTHGRAGEGATVANILAKLAAFFAGEFHLKPHDLGALLYAARVRNLSLARATASKQRSFTCRFLREIANQGAGHAKCARAAEILELIDDPLATNGHQDAKTLASLLVATLDHVGVERAIEADYIPDEKVHAKARARLANFG